MLRRVSSRAHGSGSDGSVAAPRRTPEPGPGTRAGSFPAVPSAVVAKKGCFRGSAPVPLRKASLQPKVQRKNLFWFPLGRAGLFRTLLHHVRAPGPHPVWLGPPGSGRAWCGHARSGPARARGRRPGLAAPVPHAVPPGAP